MSLVDEARTVRQRIADRLAELEPLVREYDELKQLAAEMGVEQNASAAGSESALAQPRRSTRARRTQARRREAAVADQAAAGDLATRVVDAVTAAPGKTVAEYAADLDMAPTALYRPVRQLTTSGAIVKRARQLFPA
ncbi:MAG TPA: hypothetical protein VK774_08510 [Solirubrobacteraceae bacterium]|jgi:hypothetical protein|nr:hypothetical protein [Solirubrobacteraceae bacterium]